MAALRMLFVVGLSLLASPIFAQTSDAALEKELLAILHPMYAAEKRHDLAFVRTHLSDDFAEVAGDGNVYGFDAVEKGFGEMELKDYKLTDCLARRLDGNAALLTCRMEVDATYKGTPLPRNMRVTWVWQKVKGQWKVSFEQATLVTP